MTRNKIEIDVLCNGYGGTVTIPLSLVAAESLIPLLPDCVARDRLVIFKLNSILNIEARE